MKNARGGSELPSFRARYTERLILRSPILSTQTPGRMEKGASRSESNRAGGCTVSRSRIKELHSKLKARQEEPAMGLSYSSQAQRVIPETKSHGGTERTDNLQSGA